jgi:hypothetical protein
MRAQACHDSASLAPEEKVGKELPLQGTLMLGVKPDYVTSPPNLQRQEWAGRAAH